MTNNKIHERPSQCQRIVKYLNDFGSITQLQALADLGVMRLASRISELRKKGYAIDDAQVMVINRYGEKCYIKKYFLSETVDNAKVL